jgi:hypothetical protein
MDNADTSPLLAVLRPQTAPVKRVPTIVSDQSRRVISSYFAVASIRGWWRAEGRKIYPEAKLILITADGGGGNGWRLRLWKLELQKFADQTTLGISVCHFPPGTGKWTKIEHRLFSFISSNWRGESLRDYETIVNLIAGPLDTFIGLQCLSDSAR